jgi:hypothetical protein
MAGTAIVRQVRVLLSGRAFKQETRDAKKSAALRQSWRIIRVIFHEFTSETRRRHLGQALGRSLLPHRNQRGRATPVNDVTPHLEKNSYSSFVMNRSARAAGLSSGAMSLTFCSARRNFSTSALIAVEETGSANCRMLRIPAMYLRAFSRQAALQSGLGRICSTSCSRRSSLTPIERSA